MFKRFISLFLILILIMPSQIGAAYTETEHPDEIGLVYALGIVDETKDKSETVSRGEFAYYIGRLFLQDEVLKDIEADFADCGELPKAWQGAVGYLKQVGAVGGYPDGGFYPYEPINLAATAKILAGIMDVRGFDDISDNSEYMSYAAHKGLFDGVAKSTASGLTRLEVTRIIYNTLECNLSGTTYYDEYVSGREGKCFREAFMNLYEVTGVVTDNGITSIYGETELKPGQIKIDSITVKNYTGADVLGQKVKVYYTADTRDNDNEFVWYCGEDTYNDFTAFYSFDGTEYSDYEYTYYTDRYSHKSKKAKLSTGFKLIYNGLALRAGIAFDEKYMLPDAAKIKLTDNDHNGKFDIVHVYSAETFVVKGADLDDEKLYGKNGEVISLKDYESVILLNDSGNEISEKEIFDVDNVLTISESLCKTAITVTKIDNKVSGSIEVIEDTGEIVINGGLYALEENYRPNVKIGMRGDFYLDEYSNVIHYTPQNDKIFAYLIGTAKPKSLKGLSEIKVIDERGVKKAYELKDKIVLDGSSVSAETAIDRLDSKDSAERLLRIQIDSNNRINYIDTTESNSTAEEINFRVIEGFKNVGGIDVYRTSRLIDGRIGLSSDVKIFVVDDNPSGDEDYSVVGTDYFNQSEYTCDNLTAYALDENNLASAVLLIAKEVGREVSKARDIYLVKNVVTTLDEYGDVRIKVTLLNKAGETQVMTESETSLNFTDKNGNKDVVEPGDIIRYGYNGEGYINEGNILVVYDMDKKYFNTANVYNYKETTYYSVSVVQPIYVLSNLPEYIEVSFTEPSEELTVAQKFMYPKKIFKKVYVFDCARNIITETTPDKLVGYDAAGDQCSQGVLHAYYYTDGFIVIYK